MNDFHYARVAKISYLLNTARTDGESITLGMVVQLPAVIGAELLALVCRPRLSDAEHARMDWIGQQTLADPARFFMREIDEARKVGVADLFAHLSQKFAWSIHVAPAVEIPISDDLTRDLHQAFPKFGSADDARAARPRGKRQQSRMVEVRPPNPAAAALARLAGPDFLAGDMIAVLPPPWTTGDGFSASLPQ
jgi:hypothetical protein